MTIDNRTNDPIADKVDALLSQIESARTLAGFMSAWDVSPEQLETLRSTLESVERYAALTAAGVAPQPVIDEAALAEVIADAPHSGDPNVSCLDPRCKAAAVAAWLREGVAPQEPSQTETKSGNNFVSLDPEKVAEVLLANAKSRYGGLLFEERAAARIAHALCEAYTEGKLT